MATADEQTAAHLAAGTVIDGRYRVVRYIDEGGAGRVHEVEHVLTGRHLALKSLLDESGHGRLEQEARAASLMKNAHAVKITDMGRTAELGPYLVMELLDGSSLRALLDEAGQLPIDLTADIALQVCECLAEAHGHGIIHRDLKPENVHLCPSNGVGPYDVKVLDFGVVKINAEGPIPTSSLTRTGSTVGTPFYMSLEQLRSSSNVDARADVYSLSVVLYECLAGTKPYQAETLGDLVYVLCAGPPPHLRRVRPDLPADLCDLVMRGLAIAREQRPQTMMELAAGLAPYGDPALTAWLRTERRAEMTGSISRAQALRAAPPVSAARASEPGPRSAPAPELSAGLERPARAVSAPPVLELHLPAPTRATALPTPEVSVDLGRAATVAAEDARAAAGWPASTPRPPTEATERLRPGLSLEQAIAERVMARTELAPAVAPSASAALPDLEMPTSFRGKAKEQSAPEAPTIEHGNAEEPRARDTPTEIYPRAHDGGGDIELDDRGPGGAHGALPVADSAAEAHAAAAPPAAFDGAAPLAPTSSYDSAPRVVVPPPYGRAAVEDPLTFTPPPPSHLVLAPPARPAWQMRVDEVLRDVGAHGERVGTALLDAFRTAPRQQQIALVAVGAAVLGLFVVVLGILTLGR